MAGRIYVVEDEQSVSLVRATSGPQALNHVVKSQYNVRAASADDVANYMSQGATIEDATIKIGNTEIPDPQLGSGEDGDVPV